ncbi:tRNA lysidine(34) synthetase TilS [Nakamurella leprariae]|uniref:tRNA(Ile)-lysidine synthase n=1 Tax=Nakamurella leprariae TaxID=2803911 RepID=A0A939BXS8_9ACTN|nr:tRNA lysidine(34) synthetase TilS [Nakamurella leprariae]MBM9466315.1 tRNA lysidine(34) synthetase TilS [Nakamurella leprariae]
MDHPGPGLKATRRGVPDPVDAAVAGWLRRHPQAAVVVACSGGADSLALAAATRPVVDGPLVAVTVDHGLQPGSDVQARRTVAQLDGLGYRDVRTIPVRVDGPGGPEAAARRARSAALGAVADELRTAGGGSVAVLLAHTLDDQAETVLLGLARGSGPRSLAGMRSWRAPWGRPLLGVRRADTERRCAAAGLDPWRDPHNQDRRYARVRVRHDLLPRLDEALGGGIAGALARTAELAAQDNDALDQWADELLRRAAPDAGRLDPAVLDGVPVAVRTRVLRRWSARSTTPLTFDHVSRLDALLTGRRVGAAVRLPGGVDVVRTGDGLVIQGGPRPAGAPLDGWPAGGPGTAGA